MMLKVYKEGFTAIIYQSISKTVILGLNDLLSLVFIIRNTNMNANLIPVMFRMRFSNTPSNGFGLNGF